MLGWQGTGSNQACLHQFMQRVHTLACHQIAGFLAVVIDGQTYNFGTDLVLLTSANNIDPVIGWLGPPGMWGFINNSNPWVTSIFFAFDSGDPGNQTQPFPNLLAGTVWTTNNLLSWIVGSSRWTPACLQRGRAKVHVVIHYNSQAALTQNYGVFAGPQPYVLDSGRLPTVEFKVAGRIILDYRVITAWQPSTNYLKYQYVLALADALGNGGQPHICVFVQQNTSGVSSAGPTPDFALTNKGQTFSEGGCLWLCAGAPIYAAGSGLTGLNNPQSNKLGGPGGSALIADAWQGTFQYLSGAVIEAPIGWLQQAQGLFVTGANRPDFTANGLNLRGGTTPDGGGTWICLGRSQYATCLPDDDGTQNQGGFSNPALVVADYLQTPKNQFGLGAGLTSDSIDSVIAAANICDEPVVIEVF